MTTYIDVAVSRIQAYLGRSRRLWGRRGASEELVLVTLLPAQATEEGRKECLVQEVLNDHHGVRLNEEALNMDGVVSLLGDDEEVTLNAGRDLALRIKRRLPAVTISVNWITSGEPYAALLGTDHEWYEETYQPAPCEVPIVRLCDECRTSPASYLCDVRYADVPEPLNLCLDCDTRFKENVGDRWKKVVRTQANDRFPNRFICEWWLRDELNRKRPGQNELRGSQHFQELGELTWETEVHRVRTHRDNHTALIFADGNGLGQLFGKAKTRAAKIGNTTELKDISERVKAVTKEALLEAASAILDPQDEIMPLVPHIMGGDDLLIRLPAERCWRFLDRFMTSLAQDPPGSGVEGDHMTMSAGMVICKAEVPFGDQISISERLLKDAKRSVMGKGWSFAWLDLTHDGPDGYRKPWSLDQLHGQCAALQHLGGMSANSVTSLVAAIGGCDEAIARQKLAYLCSRMPEVAELIEIMSIDAGTISAAQTTLIGDLVSIGRWWR